jgi:uncharacterized protein YjlB
MKIDELMFAESNGVPNNARLPVLVYHDAIDVSGDAARDIEMRFHANGWGALWRNGVFGYQHYHCHGHEALGIAIGRARLLLGGPAGRELEVAAGDVILLPAGTGHCRLMASDDFLVVGGYPPGQRGDIQRPPATDGNREAIASVSLPRLDPVLGADGPAVTVWRRAAGDRS